MKNISNKSCCPSQESNQVPPEYVCTALPEHQFACNNIFEHVSIFNIV